MNNSKYYTKINAYTILVYIYIYILTLNGQIYSILTYQNGGTLLSRSKVVVLNLGVATPFRVDQLFPRVAGAQTVSFLETAMRAAGATSIALAERSAIFSFFVLSQQAVNRNPVLGVAWEKIMFVVSPSSLLGASQALLSVDHSDLSLLLSYLRSSLQVLGNLKCMKLECRGFLIGL